MESSHVNLIYESETSEWVAEEGQRTMDRDAETETDIQRLRETYREVDKQI